jgi:hypothetical protein
VGKECITIWIACYHHATIVLRRSAARSVAETMDTPRILGLLHLLSKPDTILCSYHAAIPVSSG